MQDYDLLVIGAGMAGLTAAANATREGSRVLVVEVSGDVGGSARFAGYAWTAPSREVMDRSTRSGTRRSDMPSWTASPTAWSGSAPSGSMSTTPSPSSASAAATSSTPTSTSTSAVGW